jgi:hypothetical protein
MSSGSTINVNEGPGPPRNDRRSAHRHPALFGRAWLGWREGGEFLGTPAFVLDISVGGCLVAAEKEPPTRGAVLIRLDGPILPVWYEAKVVEVRGIEAAIRAVRLIFADSCPYELFMAVAYGQANRDASSRQPDLPGFHGNGHR